MSDPNGAAPPPPSGPGPPLDDADFALRFLRENKDKSFALAVGFKAAHGPFDPPPRHKDTFTGAAAKPVPSLKSKAIYRQDGNEPAKKKKKAKR